MAHWFVSNFPWKVLGAYLIAISVACFFWGPAPLVLGILFGTIASGFYCAITFGLYNFTFLAIIDEILIPEFIEKKAI